jgi:HK97 gp10 family phage protein
LAGEIIQGLGELRTKFATISDDMQKKVSLRMVAAAGGVLKKEARIIAQSKMVKRSGALFNNIVIKRDTKAPAGTTVYNLGVRHGRDMGNGKKIQKYLAIGKGGRVVVRRVNDPYYWSFVEFGHKIVARESGKSGVITSTYTRTTKNGKVRTVIREVGADGISIRRRTPLGFVEPRPFIGPALVNKRDEAIAAMEDQLQKEIVKLNK